MEKKTSKITKEFFKKEVKEIKCEVCNKPLSTISYKIKTMEFENGLIKNFIKERKEVKHHDGGHIQNLDGSETTLCIEHFRTAWLMKSSDKNFKEIVEEIKQRGNIIIDECQIDLAKEELKKEVSEKVCSGNLEL